MRCNPVNSAYRLIAVLQIILVLVLILITLLIFFPLQRQLSSQVLSLKNDILQLLETALGNNISFTSIHPSIFSYIEIRNLRLYDDQDRTLLTIDRLIFRYDIREVLKGEPLSAPRLVELRGGVAYADQFGGENLRTEGETSEADIDRYLNSLSTELRISLRNYRIEYRGPEGDFAIHSLISRGLIEYNGDTIEISLENTSEYEGFGSGILEVSGSSTVQGQVIVGSGGDLNQLLSSSAFQFYVSTSIVESDRFVLQPLDFYLALDSERFLARSLEGREPFSLELEYLLGPQSSSLVFNSAEWTPSSIIQFVGADPSYNRLLASVISSGIQVDFDGDFVPSRGEGWLETVGWIPVIDRVASISGQFDYAEMLFSLESIRVATAAGDFAGFSGIYDVDRGELDLEGRVASVSLDEVPRFSSDIDIRLRRASAFVLFEGPEIEGLKLADSSLRVNFKEQGISANFQTALAESSDGGGERGRLIVNAETRGAALLEPDSISLGVIIRNLAVADARAAIDDFLYREAPGGSLPPEIDSANINAEVSGVIGDLRTTPVIEVSAPVVRLGSPSGELLRLSASYKDGILLVPDLTLMYGDFSAAVGINGNLRNAGRYQFDIASAINGFSYDALVNYYPPRRSLFAKGSYNTTVNLQLDDARAKLSYRVSDLPMTMFGERGSLTSNGNADIDLADPAGSELTIQRLVLADARIFPLEQDRLGEIELRVSGSVADGIVLEQIGYRDFISRLDGSGEISFDGGVVDVQAFLGNDNEEIIAYGLLDGQSIRAGAQIIRLPVRRLGLTEIVGLLDAQIDIDGTISDPAVTFSLETINARLAEDTLFLRAEGRLAGEVLRIDDGQVELSSIAARNLQARFDIAGGSLDIDAGLFLADATGQKKPFQQLESSMNVPAVPLLIGQGADGLILSDLWVGGSGTIRLTASDEGNPDPEIWNLTLADEAGDLAISGGPRYAAGGVQARLSPDGSFSGSFADPIPVTFDADGFFEGSAVDLNLTSLRLDIDELLAGSDDGDSAISFLGGQGSGGIRITGSIVDPDFYGTLIVKGLRADLPTIIPEDLVVQTAFIIFEGKEIFFPEVPVEAGPDGRASLTGALSMDRWLPDTLVLQISTGSDSVPITSDFNSVVVDGFASGDIEIGYRFADPALWIVGDLVANATGITLSNLNDEADDAAESDEILVDLRISTGRGVEFYWPARNFPILRSSAITGETIEIKYSFPPDNFSLVGDVALRGGELFYFEQNFYIREGRIRFNESEDFFDPLLSANAEVRSADANGPVRIYLQIEEDRLSQLQPRFTSVPSKPEPEIIAILGGQIIGNGGQQIEIADAVLTGSEILGQVGVFREIETEIRDRLSLDLFSIRTGLFQNFLQDVIVTPDPEYSLNNNSPITVGRYLQNTTLLMGRYIGDEVFMELMVQLQEQNPVNRPANDFIGIEIDAELSLEWATPFFDLTWTFAPENPDTLFVTDHTLTFTRDFSLGNQ
jgi:translocation and assembly module TamB